MRWLDSNASIIALTTNADRCDSTKPTFVPRIASGGLDHELIVPRGAWWRHVEERIAKREGDTDRVERLKAEGVAELAAMIQKFAKIL